ncbi:MAG: glycosyltransferase family 39 protein [Caldisericia bacterium]|nr:glycosyltransferase family 39 protein [Caldisericia bacterium]
MKKHLWAIIILIILAAGLALIQFRYPLALNYDGGYNAANTNALMNMDKMPFSGSPILPFSISALFGLIAGSASAGIKIASTLALVSVGWMIYAFTRKITNDEMAGLAALLGWCVTLGVFNYIYGYLKQTIALPFLVGGLMTLYFAIEEKKLVWWILWIAGAIGTYLSHTPAFMTYAVCSAFVGAVMFYKSTYKYAKVVAIMLWVGIGLGLLSIPWSVPFLSKYVPQLSLGGWRTILIYIKGLFSHRYQMTTDFNLFDIPVLLLPVAGLVLVWLKQRKLGWWFFAFGCGVLFISLFAVKYEWQGRNIMTMFVPIAMLSGLGIWEMAKLLSKEKLARVITSIVLAAAIFFCANWPLTLKQHVADARPLVNQSQVDDLKTFLGTNGKGSEFIPSLYARHGLRFWATYATGDYVGVLFYDWDKKTLGIRQSRSGEDLGPSHTPSKGEYLLLSKTALFSWPTTVCAGEKLRASIPTKAQEYLLVDLRSTDKMDDVWIAIRDKNWGLLKKVYFRDITYGTNKTGMLLTGIKRGQYWVQVGYDEQSLPPAKIEIEENLLEWATTDFTVKAQSQEYLIIEAK